MADKKSKKKLFILIILPLLLVVIGAGGWFGWKAFLAPKKEVVAEQVPIQPVVPIFYDFEALTVNLQRLETDDTDKFLYVKLTLVLPNDESRKIIHTYLPQATSRLILLLSAKNADELMTSEGKLALVEEIKKTLSMPYSSDTPAIEISNVLLTNFIIQ